MKNNSKKEAKNQKAKKIAKTILVTLGVTGMVASVMVFPGLVYVYDWLDKSVGENSVRSRRSLKRLEQRGMIQIRKKGQKHLIVLTPKGKKQIFKYKFRDLEIKKPIAWDGKWRIVMFDVPEANRGARDIMRRKLFSLGFVSLQKSVLVHPYPCDEVIEVIRDYYKLQPGQLYVFDSIVKEGEAELRKHFKL